MSAFSHMEVCVCVCVCVMAALALDLLEVMSSLLMSASSNMEVCVCGYVCCASTTACCLMSMTQSNTEHLFLCILWLCVPCFSLHAASWRAYRLGVGWYTVEGCTLFIGPCVVCDVVL